MASTNETRGTHEPTALVPRGAWLLAVGIAASGCTAPIATTSVVSPAHGEPGKTGFGTGVSVASGSSSLSLVQISSSVVVAASSDPDGPSDTHEGDTVWRVRGSMMELCRWSADGADDCVLATVEAKDNIGLISFLPTIIEPGNLGRGAGILLVGNQQTAHIQSLAQNPTQPVAFDRDQTIWVSGGFLMPVYVCSAKNGIPSCLPLPILLDQPVASLMVRRGDRRVPVLWARGISPDAKVGEDPFSPLPRQLFRCEAHDGKPTCKVAKEIAR